MRKPIVIGREAFETKKAATERCRSALYRYEIGRTVTGDDSEFLANLILLHSEAAEKIGCGVRSFQVEQNGPTRGFWLTRTDGTRTDFSFVHCLTPRTAEREALDALRWAIRDQIREFRDAAMPAGFGVCAVTGVGIGPAIAHVDHEPPFAVLVRDFLAGCVLSLAEIRVKPTADWETVTVLADEDLARDWAEYHRSHAGLRLVSAEANLGLLRRRLPK